MSADILPIYLRPPSRQPVRLSSDYVGEQVVIKGDMPEVITNKDART